MHEHEVPTHVQAEDRVLLWFTFPQLIALAAVAALSYGIYHYAPIGSGTIRLLFGIGFAATGIAMVAGKVGGRPLPAVLADLLRFSLGARRFAGLVSQLVRAESPTPPATHEQSARRPRTRGERMPRVPLGWFRKRDRKRRPKRELEDAKQSIRRESNGHRLRWPALVGAAGLALVLSVGTCTPPITPAQEPSSRPQLPEEIEFEPSPLVEGRRLYVERLTVTATEATVVLKAATDLDVSIQIFGGDAGRTLIANRSIELTQGERSTQQLVLDGDLPSFTFAWTDEFNQAGAVTLAGSQLPHPLPTVDGELCDLQVTKLEWRPRKLSGAIKSDCAATVDEIAGLQTVTGHVNISQKAVLTANMQTVSGTIQVSADGSTTSIPLVADGTKQFELAVDNEETTFNIALSAMLDAELSIPLPPIVRLTHHPARTEQHSQTVSSVDPESGEAVSETVTFNVTYPAYIGAQVSRRSPQVRNRQEQLALAASIAADAPYEALEAPEATTGSTQTVVVGDELSELFALLGWELN